jgi:hypothetical protein
LARPRWGCGHLRRDDNSNWLNPAPAASQHGRRLDIPRITQHDIRPSPLEPCPNLCAIDARMLEQDQRVIAVSQSGHCDTRPAAILAAGSISDIS